MLAGHELRGMQAALSERPSAGGTHGRLPKRAGLFDARRLRSRHQRLAASDDEFGPDLEPDAKYSDVLQTAEPLAEDVPLSEWVVSNDVPTDEDEAAALAKAAEKEARKVELLGKLTESVTETFAALEADGIPCIKRSHIKIGNELSRGAFGIVRNATMLSASNDGVSTTSDVNEDIQIEVAVKTLSTGWKSATRVLENFATEVRMGWRAAWKARAGLRAFHVATPCSAFLQCTICNFDYSLVLAISFGFVKLQASTLLGYCSNLGYHLTSLVAIGDKIEHFQSSQSCPGAAICCIMLLLNTVYLAVNLYLRSTSYPPLQCPAAHCSGEAQLQR
eukprot:SAG31_NODE_6962_length_1833_cov_1.683968_1_plen_334_part_00